MFFSLRFTRRAVGIALLALLAGLLLGFAGRRSASAALPASAPPEGSVRLPIVMYHSVLKDQKRQGKYVISPQIFENDLKYLASHGFHTVGISDVIGFVKQGTPLPEKPIVLTFDDGYYNNYLYAYPLAQKYAARIVISPIGYYTDQFSKTGESSAYYSHVTWDEISEMMKSGCVEFQNHTYRLHASSGGRLGAQKLKSESREAYARLLTEDLSKFQNRMREMTGYAPSAFVYPFGAVSEAALPVIRELGFQATLTCEEKMNNVTKDPESLFGLGRYLRTSEGESAAFFEKKMKLSS